MTPTASSEHGIAFLLTAREILTVAVENYREYKSIERSFDLLALEYAGRGGCTLPAGYDF